MSDVTLILHAIEQGDPRAAEQLLPLIYDELRKLAAVRMAQESPDHTLQATALVHEAYLRLVDGAVVHQSNSRRHFFAAAAESMQISVRSAERLWTYARTWLHRELSRGDAADPAPPEAAQ